MSFFPWIVCTYVTTIQSVHNPWIASARIFYRFGWNIILIIYLFDNENNIQTCVCVSSLKCCTVNEFVWCCRWRTVTIVCARRRRIVWYCTLLQQSIRQQLLPFLILIIIIFSGCYVLFFAFQRMCCRCCISFFVIILVLSNRLTCVHMLKTPYSAEMEFVTSESNLCPKIMFVVLQFFSISSRCIPIFCFVHLFHSLTSSFRCNV